ncbi:hypothetical protein [Mycobacterium marinum]|uniref:hypothetical protein n=1 Tax=Mycobacterium marinum TaxID=1781 RepID=UPI00356A1174
MTAPEPYKDPTPEYRRRCYDYRNDPHLLACQQTGDQSTEFGYGPGLVPLRNNGQPPSEGGTYMPRAPRVDPPPSGVGQPGNTADHAAKHAATQEIQLAREPDRGC